MTTIEQDIKNVDIQPIKKPRKKPTKPPVVEPDSTKPAPKQIPPWKVKNSIEAKEYMAKLRAKQKQKRDANLNK